MTSSFETSDTRSVFSAMANEHFRRGKEEGKKEGRAESKAVSILTVLKARNLHVTDAERECIAACTDLGQLKTWLRRAVTAEKTSDLFD